MEWAFPVAAGPPIEVRLFFANRYSGTSRVGSRVFDVSIDGTPFLTNFDIVAAVGDQTGMMKAFDITSDGTVNIDFSHVVENPLINAIEIIDASLPAPQQPGNTHGVGLLQWDDGRDRRCSQQPWRELVPGPGRLHDRQHPALRLV